MARLKKEEWWVAVDNDGSLLVDFDGSPVMNKKLWKVKSLVAEDFIKKNIIILKMRVKMSAKAMERFINEY